MNKPIEARQGHTSPKQLRVNAMEPAMVLIADYCRLDHNEDGSIDFLIVDSNGVATWYCFDEEGRAKESLTGWLPTDVDLEDVTELVP